MPVIGKKTDNYQLGTQRRVILEEEKKSNQRIRNLKRSLGKEQETRKNIKRRKTKNAILTKKVREVKEIADSLPSVLAQQRRVFIEVVSKADASPLGLNANLGAGVLAGMSLPFAPALKHYHSIMFDTKIDHFFHFSYPSGS